MRRKKVLLLGLRHAVRAPMAEAVLRARVGDAIDIASAGLEPAHLHPLTLVVLEEAGFTLYAHAPVSAKTLLGHEAFSTVILISGPSDSVRPRMFFGALETERWEVDDPSIVPEASRLDAFRRCRDHIVALVDGWVAGHVRLDGPRRSERTPTRIVRIPRPNLI
jgi:protein-tyrosine-phosphatase